MGSAVHLAFQGFQAVDLSFDRAFAPAVFEGGLNGGFVGFQAGCEAANLGRRLGVCGTGQPLSPLAAAGGERWL